MDKLTYYTSLEANATLRSKYKVPCHRSWIDIVIPQVIQYGMPTHLKYNNTRIPYRGFDSTFSGSYWGDREPFYQMVKTEWDDYNNIKTERFKSFEGGIADGSLLYRGYFMYAPCGLACWSQVSNLLGLSLSFRLMYCSGYSNLLLCTQFQYLSLTEPFNHLRDLLIGHNLPLKWCCVLGFIRIIAIHLV